VVGIFETDKNVQPAGQHITVSPNPCSGHAELVFEMEEPCHATLKIYNIAGKQVEAVRALKLCAGTNRIDLDVSDYRNGIFLAVINAGNKTLTGKIAVK